MLNKVILIGRLTKDPDIKMTTSGIPVGTFSLAVDRNFKTASGEREADFINCVCYRKTAELVGQYLKKGSQISVEGRIQTRSYDAQDGTKRYVTEVVCENVVFLDTRSQSQGTYQQQGGFQSQYQPQQQFGQYNQQQPSFNVGQPQAKYNNPTNNQMFNNSNTNKSQPNDDYFNDNPNIDISEDDLPF